MVILDFPSDLGCWNYTLQVHDACIISGGYDDAGNILYVGRLLTGNYYTPDYYIDGCRTFRYRFSVYVHVLGPVHSWGWKLI